MATDKTKEQEKYLEATDKYLKISDIIIGVVWAILIISVWFYFGKDYEDEATTENIVFIDK